MHTIDKCAAALSYLDDFDPEMCMYYNNRLSKRPTKI